MTGAHVRLALVVVAAACAVLFAALWARARGHADPNVLVIELYVAPSAQSHVDMPFPIEVRDHTGRVFTAIDHHGIAQVVLIPPTRYPVVVEARPGCTAFVRSSPVAVVDVGLAGRRCTAHQVD